MLRLALLVVTSAVGSISVCQGLQVTEPSSSYKWLLTKRPRSVSWEYQQEARCTTDWVVEIRPKLENGATSETVHSVSLPKSDVLVIGQKHRTFISVPQYILTGQHVVRVSCHRRKKVSDDENHESEIFGESDAFQIINMQKQESEGRLSYERRLFEGLQRWRADQRVLSVEPVVRGLEGGGECSLPRLVNPSPDLFLARCLRPQRVCAIANLTDHWPARFRWQLSELEKDHRIDGVYVTVDRLVPLARWNKWRTTRANDTQVQPMVFMPEIFDLYPALSNDYDVPEVMAMQKDMMRPIKDHLRMDWRWMIMAAGRSGSHFHVDPLNTSAWLVVTSGRKLWGFYPKEVHFVPGMKQNNYTKNDYTVADSYNWWISTYPHLRQDYKPDFCIQRPGDMFFIPKGIWHNILNLEDTVSVTQNFVAVDDFTETLEEMHLTSNAEDFSPETFVTLRSLYRRRFRHHLKDKHLAYSRPAEHLPCQGRLRDEAWLRVVDALL